MIFEFEEQANNAKSVLEEKDFKNFIETREIKPEDFRIIEELSLFDKDFFIYFHNFFSANRSAEFQIKELESQINNLKHDLTLEYISDDAKKEKKKQIPFQNLLLEFLRKYGPGISQNLIAVFERRKK